jgi:Trp operon repressor
MKTTTLTVTLTADEADDVRELIKIVRDALDNSFSHTVLCAHVGHSECDALEAKLAEAAR